MIMDMKIIMVDMTTITGVTMNILLVDIRTTVAMVTIDGLLVYLVVLQIFLCILEIITTMTMLDRIPKCFPVLTQYFQTRMKKVTRILSILVTKVIMIMIKLQHNLDVSL